MNKKFNPNKLFANFQRHIEIPQVFVAENLNLAMFLDIFTLTLEFLYHFEKDKLTSRGQRRTK